MTAYLVDHPPARSQYRHPRRSKPTGCIVIHSAENVPDLNPPDTGAEAVAKFIEGRSDPGSYHVICDSDSAIQLVDFADEAFQDGTGSNPWAIGISGAFRAHQWDSLPLSWRQGVVEQMAQACLRAALWLKDVHGVDARAVQITRAQSDAGQAGLISHALRDPDRRSDPGAECLARVTARFAELLGAPQEDDMVRIVTFKGRDPFGANNQWVVDFGQKTRWRIPDPGMLAILRDEVKVPVVAAPIDGGGHFREIT